ncbi:alkaline phosphatase [Myxococcus sp. MxC21-1]|uniref:alkaline phosphatase n=1 Tax=Myxococcus sp. MxC21-1 TaxID=3041439 RepID=UPI00292D224F|nr:alkaline phosphatase [Myxococcus sp. MxC21-1]WNZ64846.1 alkaline phosphatase [Myxococcus sp. MxC21-1]
MPRPCTGSVNESNAAAKGAARAEHLLVLATMAALLAVGAVRRLRTRRLAQRPR